MSGSASPRDLALDRRLEGLDPEVAARALSESRAPFVIGVRHHSPALSAAIPTLLDAFAPTALLIELPPDFDALVPWLAHPDTLAPVALAATTATGLAFYPFADFSPELSALRWAARANVPVIAIDRPLRARERSDHERPRRNATASPRLLDGLAHGDDVEELWDRLVEGPAPASSPEALRTAALYFGFLLRADTLLAGRISADDAARERHMRHHVTVALDRGERVAAVVGAFHANALVAEPLGEHAPLAPPPSELALPPADASLVPYDFALFDSRSGYPAGIRDPALVQLLYELASRGRTLADAMPGLLVDVARRMRARGHVASFSDVREAARLGTDLATLRGLVAPGRRELLEALETAFAQGELLGRGRVLAQALEAVFVGSRRGRLAKGAPRAGLAVHTEALLRELGLPGPDGVPSGPREAKELTLDPLRSPLDRRRSVVLERLGALGVPYAERRVGNVGGVRGDLERLSARYRVRFTPETAARLELAAMAGITLEQAVLGTLGRRVRQARDADTLGPAAWLAALEEACVTGLPSLASELLATHADDLVARAGLPELVATLALLARLEAGAFPGLPRDPSDACPPEIVAFVEPLSPVREAVFAAAVLALEGLGGTDRDDDIRALGELLALLGDEASGALPSLVDRLLSFERTGSPLMRGAALAALTTLGKHEPVEAFTTFVSFFDWGGDDTSAARQRTLRIRGTLLLGGPRFEGHPAFAETILGAIDRVDEPRFLARLPSLRAGFDVLSTAARSRLLDELLPLLPKDATNGALGALDFELDGSPEQLRRHALADRAAVDLLARLGLGDARTEPAASPPTTASPRPALASPPSIEPGRALSLGDRLRLLLGRDRGALGASAARYARALDELYGTGRGEGSREEGAGRGPAFPTTREWADELGDLFPLAVREEILGRSAENGNAAAVLALDADAAHPSVELLTQVLSLRGSVGEGQLGPLRRLARRIVDALAKELASVVRPALTGLALPRSTRRPRGPLDLRGTVQRNLRTARLTEGTWQLAPTELVFRTRAQRHVAWRVVLVVDVSGSMDASVIYSAIMASVLAAVPALATSFFAFSDDVLDLTHHVDDPLALLLGVRVGGGTNIAKGVRAARNSLTHPSRSLVVVISDFEEGGPLEPLLAELRALRDSGATVLGLAALDDGGAPRFHRMNAERIASLGIAVAALSPLELARWVGDHVRKSAR